MTIPANGEAQAAMQDAEAHQRLLDIAARADVFEAIARAWMTPRMVASIRHASYSPICAADVTYRVEFAARAARDLEHHCDQIDRCRIIYGIDEYARKVRIVSIRHGAMEPVSPEEL